jgi:ligand-binding sensor domain-containing protein
LEDGYLHLRENGVWRLYPTPLPKALLPLPRALFADREGTLWIVGDGGIAQATATAVRALVPDGSNPDKIVYSLAQDDVGRVWATTQGRALLWEHGSFSC